VRTSSTVYRPAGGEASAPSASAPTTGGIISQQPVNDRVRPHPAAEGILAEKTGQRFHQCTVTVESLGGRDGGPFDTETQRNRETEKQHEFF